MMRRECYWRSKKRTKMPDAIGPAGLEVVPVVVVERKRLYDGVLREGGREGGRRTRRREGGKEGRRKEGSAGG
jgi:hypothetical protein